jgi:hypothetical protein
MHALIQNEMLIMQIENNEPLILLDYFVQSSTIQEEEK